MVMMKHLQEPVPSVLDERKDLPASIGRVIARAMAKLPANRYQNVAELVEDLTIASGTAQFAPVPGQPVINTGSTPAVTSDDRDEITVVRARQEAPPAMTPRRAPVTVPIQGTPPPMAPAVAAPGSFNLLKVIIPSMVALLVVFAVIYALKRTPGSEQQNTNQPQQNLAADPNSQPVQPGAPPTGKAEEGIPAGGRVSANANANVNANAEVSPLPVEDVSPTANVNANENSNVNTNSNTNRKAPALPEPTRSVVPEAVPSPVVPKLPAEKPSPVPTDTPPL